MLDVCVFVFPAELKCCTIIKECDTFTCSLSKPSSSLPYSSMCLFLSLLSIFSVPVHLYCSLKLQHNGSSICFQFCFSFLSFHSPSFLFFILMRLSSISFWLFSSAFNDGLSVIFTFQSLPLSFEACPSLSAPEQAEQHSVYIFLLVLYHGGSKRGF